MADDTAGDPVTGVKWCRRTTEKIADKLRAHGIDVCANTVANLLKQLGFRLRVNQKKVARPASPAARSSSSTSPPNAPSSPPPAYPSSASTPSTAN